MSKELTKAELELMGSYNITLAGDGNSFTAWDETGDTIMTCATLEGAILAQELYCSTYLVGVDVSPMQHSLLDYLRLEIEA